MSSARWQSIEQLYHDAVAQPPVQRLAFLRQACGSDLALLHEVTSLLACETDAGEFLERPAMEEAARALVADQRSLIGRELGGYRIDTLLGCGGMGEVYRASDARLEREVALKVVAEGLSGDSAYVRRFEEEARAASGLNHPGIVTIYGVGEEQGVAFIAMELVQGRTLGEVLADGAMPLATAWNLALQLAEALAAAHAARIVHRDLKPDNIMVTPDGRLKVLDFGIARRDRELAAITAMTGATLFEAGLTADGAIVGTAGYMSPEQASGLPAGSAADQFSFGVILYEMLTARRAFARGTARETIAAILEDQPAPVEQINGAVPAALRRILTRVLNKSASARYADTRELTIELRRAHETWQRAQAGGLTRRQAIVAAATFTAAAAGGGATWALGFRDRGIRSIAVLPFVNATGHPSADYLCDGLTEGLIRRLSLPSLKVVGRSTAFNYKRGATDVVNAIKGLGVDAAITGEMRRLEGRLRIAVALVAHPGGNPLWTRTFERPAGEALLVQEEIVRGVLDEGMRFKPTQADRQVLSRPPTVNPDAYDLYLRGLSIFRRDTEDDYLAAQGLLREAVRKDPSFAEGHAALAATYSVLATDGYMRPNEAWAASVSSAQRALAIDPGDPTAHAELGAFFFFFDWDCMSAERAWETARRARGGRYEPDFLIAYALERWAIGRPEAALELTRQARELDPVGPAWALRQGDFLLANNNLAEAQRVYDLLTRELPDDARVFFGLAEVRRRQGRFDEAIVALAAGHAAGGNAALQAVLSSARGEAGLRRVERVTAQLQLEQLRDRAADGRYVCPLDFARTYAQMGEAAAAFDYFPAAVAERSPGLVFLRVDRAWDGVRADPRFRATVDKVNLGA